MKRLLDPFFISYFMLWTAIHLLRHIEQPLPVLNSYLTDLIAVPAIAHVAVVFTGRFITRNKNYTYPLPYLLFIAAYVSVVFEWLMPRFSTVYTSDSIDILCYFGGALFYYYIHSPIAKKEQHQIVF